MKRLLLLLAIVLLPSAAAEIEHMSSVIDVDASQADYRIRILFTESPVGVWEYPILFPINDFEYTSSFGGNCASIREPYGSLIRCSFPDDDTDGRNLVLRFSSTDPVTKINGETLFETDITAPEFTKTLVAQVILDQGLVVIDEGKTFVPFSPTDADQGSDGRRIFLLWERSDVVKGEGLNVDIVFERVAAQSNGINIALIVIGIVILLIISLMAVIGYIRKGTLPMLKVDEEKIVGILKESHGMVKQNVLVRETGFSKAKVSRLIRDMEERGIIHTKHVGRSNEVYLGKSKSKEDSETKSE